MTPVLTTNGLTKRYGKFTALDDFTMTVPKGAIYGFVGRNGAGKTTLIRVICGLQAPTSGEYSIYGVGNRNRKIAKFRRRMGTVVENQADVYAKLNVTQLTLALAEKGCEVRSIEERDESLEGFFINLVGGDGHESTFVG